MYDQTPEIKPAAETVPWNRGKLIGQNPALTRKQIWGIRIRLQMDRRQDLALFNLAFDSTLRGCDLFHPRIRDRVLGDLAVPRAAVMRRKTPQSVRFKVIERSRNPVDGWGVEHTEI